MPFCTRAKKPKGRANAGRVRKGKKTAKKSAPLALDAELLALAVLEAGLSADEVVELARVSPDTIRK